MGLLLSTPIATARGILNDPGAVRYSAADLLTYGNDALDQIVGILPQLFHTDATLTCVAGVAQELTLVSALALVRVNNIQSGNAVTPADRSMLDRFNPAWRSATAAATTNWMPVDGHPRRFLVTPPAVAGQVLNVTYVAVPGEYAVSADTGVPASLADAVADYIVYRAESRDDEFINTNRAAQFLASFVQKVTG